MTNEEQNACDRRTRELEATRGALFDAQHTIKELRRALRSLVRTSKNLTLEKREMDAWLKATKTARLVELRLKGEDTSG